MIRLRRSPQESGSSFLGAIKWRLHSFCNKTTVFYWMQSATVNKGDFDELVTVGSIWNTWTDTLGRQPHFQLDDFFAFPVSVAGEIAKTIPEILRAHECICCQAQDILEEKGDGPKIDSRYFRLHPPCEALIANSWSQATLGKQMTSVTMITLPSIKAFSWFELARKIGPAHRSASTL